ncbi:hypothetical protein Efla_004908 [Eimeria flavescens]
MEKPFCSFIFLILHLEPAFFSPSIASPTAVIREASRAADEGEEADSPTVPRSQRGGPPLNAESKRKLQAFALSACRYTGQFDGCMQKGVPSKEEAAAIAAAVASVRGYEEEIQVSELWQEIQTNLHKALQTELCCLSSLARRNSQPVHVASSFNSEPDGRLSSAKATFSLVCLGLGSPTECSDVFSCRCQLALALLIQRLLGIPSERVQVGDPVMNASDVFVLARLFPGISGAAEGKAEESDSESETEFESHRQPLAHIAVYLAPHCDADLYGDILGFELGMQAFCLNCFSCLNPSSSKCNATNEKRDRLPSENIPQQSRTDARGFVLIGNLLGSYEMRRSLFGELHLDEFQTNTNYGHNSSVSHSDLEGKRGDASAQADSRWSCCACSNGITQKGQNGVFHLSELEIKNQIRRQEGSISLRESAAEAGEAARCMYPQQQGPALRVEFAGSAEPEKTFQSSEDGIEQRGSLCRWVSLNRGAFLLLELLPYIREWPLEQPFSPHPRAFNDLSVSAFPYPRTHAERTEFWKETLKLIDARRRNQANEKHRQRQRQKKKQPMI